MRRSVILALAGLVGLLVYIALVARFPIGSLIAIPRANVGSITRWQPQAALLMAGAGLILHGAYVTAVLASWPATRTLAEPSRLVVWSYPIVASCFLVLIWPITSTDLFDYIFRGRMSSHYEVNPYTVLPNRYKDDPFFPYLGWPNAPSAYGPLWEVISARMSAVGGVSMWRNLLLHKAFALLTFVLCGVLIARISAERPSSGRSSASLLWLWSPLALFEIVGMGHNDGLIVLSMLLAIWAVNHGRYRWAAVALTLGALFKFLPLILLPLLMVHGARRRPDWPARFRLAAELTLITVALLVIAYIPYWDGLRTLSNITLREKFLNAAPLAIVTHTLSQWWHIDLVRPIVSRIGTGLLALGLLWQMWQIWRNGRDLRSAWFGLLTWYLIVASQWFQPWYILWLLALVALHPSRSTFAWVATWALFAQASYLLQYFGLRWLKWPGNQLPAQRLYLLVIFLPPLLVWGIGRWRHRSSPPQLPQSERALAA